MGAELPTRWWHRAGRGTQPADGQPPFRGRRDLGVRSPAGVPGPVECAAPPLPAPHVLFNTPSAPDLRPGTAEQFHPFDTIHRAVLKVGRLPEQDAHHAVVVPVSGQRVVIIGRRGDPPFFPSELTRLAYLTGSEDVPELPRRSGPRADRSQAHRTPVSSPLYLRDSARSSDTTPG